MKLNNSRWLWVLSAVLLVVALACRFGAPAERGSQPQAREVESSGTIQVSAQEFSFTLDASQAQAGEVTFIVTNNGTMPHDFSIEGEGVNEKTPMIDPGESATLTVELEPGSYTYICTLPGHAMLGMKGTFTVTSN